MCRLMLSKGLVTYYLKLFHRCRFADAYACGKFLYIFVNGTELNDIFNVDVIAHNISSFFAQCR